MKEPKKRQTGRYILENILKLFKETKKREYNFKKPELEE